MQVKNFGRAGRTKYTHLVDQDTTEVSNVFLGGYYITTDNDVTRVWFYLHLDQYSLIQTIDIMISGIQSYGLNTHLTFIGVSLSKPYTSVISLHPCVCMFVCLLGPTTYRKSFPALILHV